MIEGDWLSNGLRLLLGYGRYGIITPHTEIHVYVRTPPT